MGTVRTTSAASLDTSSCRTSVCWQDLPSCCSLLSSRTKSFLILAFSLGGDWHEFSGRWRRESYTHQYCSSWPSLALFEMYTISASHATPVAIMACASILISLCISYDAPSDVYIPFFHHLSSVSSNLYAHCEAVKKKTKKRVETLIQHFVSSVPVNS